MNYLAVAFLVIAIMCFITARHQRQKAGIPAGRIIYVDTRQWGKVEKPLYDPQIRLAGKPDYLVRKSGQVIPVEVKSGKARHGPSDWHISQLAAYCLLVEREYGVRPPYGIINYPNRSFAVDFTKTLEESTRGTIQEMQRRTSQIQIERSHHEPWRCLHCGFRPICNQALRI